MLCEDIVWVRDSESEDRMLGFFSDPRLAIFLVIVSIIIAFKFDFSFTSGFSRGDSLQVFNGLKVIQAASTRPKDKFIALGYNACVDIVLDAVEFLEALGVQPLGDEAGDVCSSIKNKAELGSCFQHFFATASGAERTIFNEQLMKEIAKAVEQVPHQALLGGTAALMGEVLANDFGFDGKFPRMYFLYSNLD